MQINSLILPTINTIEYGNIFFENILTFHFILFLIMSPFMKISCPLAHNTSKNQ